MDRRLLLSGLALLPIAPSAGLAQTAPGFAMSSPAKMVDRIVALVERGGPDPVVRADAAAGLARLDPVAMLCSILALQSPDVDLSDIVARIWGRPDDAMDTALRSISSTVRNMGPAATSVGNRLYDPAPPLFGDPFFDRLEAISRQLPMGRHPTGSFEAFGAWQIVTHALAPIAGLFHGPRIGSASGVTDIEPLLFDPAMAQGLADRFEVSAIADDALLMAWIYRPSFERFLTVHELPERLPPDVVVPGPRLTAAYRKINGAQMQAFRDSEVEMMETGR